MRSLQHFHAIEIEEDRADTARARDIDAVDAVRDRALGIRIRAGVADAANVGLHRCAGHADGEARHDGRELCSLRDARLLKRVRAHHGNGERGALNGFFAALSGDEDFLEPARRGVVVAVCVGRRLRARRGRGAGQRHEQCAAGRRTSNKCQSHRPYPPGA